MPIVAVGIAEDLPERALAREADHERPADRGELGEPPDELEVVLDGLAEADARVEADELLADPLAETAKASRSSRNAFTSETTSS